MTHGSHWECIVENVEDLQARLWQWMNKGLKKT